MHFRVGVARVHTVSMRPAPTGNTKVAGVIGDPVRHSLSPALHNAAFSALGLDWTYLAFEVPSGQGADAVAAMRVLGIDGLSVTMPHKDTVAAAVDELSPAAALLGAVNCVRRDGDRLIGENTDGAGFLRSLRTQAGVDPAGLHTVVLGAGGAARAVIVALAAGGALVTVVNRSPAAAERAAALGASAGRATHAEASRGPGAPERGATATGGAPAEASRGPSGSAAVGDLGAVRGADVVVNATPLGMTDGDPLPVDPALLSDGQLVADLIYRPERTPLLTAAVRAGATTLNGVGMLLYQAAEQFTMWTGYDAPVDTMAAAVGLDLAGS